MAGDALILDTCALLWLACGARRLSDLARARIRAVPTVWICAITGFEIGLKARRGQLDLPCPVPEWLAGVIEHHALSVLPLDLGLCVRATALPPIHRDPADRFIIAAALERSLPVVTGDPLFVEYGVTTIC